MNSGASLLSRLRLFADVSSETLARFEHRMRRREFATVVLISFANNRLTLAMTAPSNVVAFDDVRRVIKGVLIEPAAVTEDDFKRFMPATYPQLVAQNDAAVQPQRQPTPRLPGSGPGARQGAAASKLVTSVVSVDI